MCGVDAERSVFFDHYVSGDPRLTLERGSRIEGIGRPRVEASFVPGVMDAMVKVPDVWSLGAMRALSVRAGPPRGRLHRHQPGGGAGLRARPEGCAASGGSVVTLLCDDGQRYQHTYFDDDWLRQNDLECGAQSDAVGALIDRGEWPAELRRTWRQAGDLSL